MQQKTTISVNKWIPHIISYSTHGAGREETMPATMFPQLSLSLMLSNKLKTSKFNFNTLDSHVMVHNGTRMPSYKYLPKSVRVRMHCTG